MSHFQTAVFLKETKDLQKALAPYQENNTGDCPKKFMKFVSVYKECKKDYEKECEQVKTKYPTLSLYIKEYCDYEFDFEKKAYGYWENPNAKWDYWSLCEKDGFARFVDLDIPNGFCKVKDFRKELSRTEYASALRFWETFVEGKPLHDGEKEPFDYYSKEYYLRNFKGKEDYATFTATPHPYAFIDPQGKWHEPGRMLMFGFEESCQSAKEAFLREWESMLDAPENQNLYVAFVDCHI